MHKHTCLNCSKVIEEGDFDCELDADHDYSLCDECYCHGCGVTIALAAAIWHDGDPYCDECESAEAE